MRTISVFSTALSIGACLLFATPAQADQVPLTVGGTTIQFPVEAGYVRISTSAPKVFEITQAALPPTNRLVEVFETSADLARQQAGQPLRDPFYQVQVIREIEERHVGLDEWKQALPQLTAGMANVDMNKVANQELSGANDRMTAAAGQPVGMTMGKLGQPQIYRQTPASFAFTMVVPIQVNVGGQNVSGTMGVAGGMLVAGNRVIDVNVYTSSASPESLADLRDRLDRTVDQTIALNPSDRGGFDWSKVGQKAMIGALIGAVIGVFGMLFRRKG